MAGLNWDYHQEQNDKFSNRISQYAKDISECATISETSSVINSLYSFLMGIGYTDRTLLPLKDSIYHHKENNEKGEIVNCINRLAKDVRLCGLPISKGPSTDISISNQNSQNNNVNIELITKSISDELTSEQLEQLGTLIKNNKRGDLKKWLGDLGNNTLSGILSSLLMNVGNMF